MKFCLGEQLELGKWNFEASNIQNTPLYNNIVYQTILTFTFLVFLFKNESTKTNTFFTHQKYKTSNTFYAKEKTNIESSK